MAEIVLLALAAAVFPILLACVAVMISRPEPRPLLLAFYAGGMLISIVSGLIVLGYFKDHGDVLGSSSSSPSPGFSIAAGLVGLALAWLMVSRRGRAALDSWRSRRRERRPSPPAADKGPSWPERQLGRANAMVAFGVGVALNLPGPFYLLALGDIATGDYSRAQEIGLILLFNLIMFVLLELPLAGYLVQPEQTAARVARLSDWLNANGLRVVGGLVGVVAIGQLVQGIAAATS